MVKIPSFKPIKLVQKEEKGGGLCQMKAREFGALIGKAPQRNHTLTMDV
jgi:hypothetical protein